MYHGFMTPEELSRIYKGISNVCYLSLEVDPAMSCYPERDSYLGIINVLS